MVIDGTPIPIDRIAADRPFYSGCDRRQILAARRDPGLIALGDKGYHGYDPTGQHVVTSYEGRNKPESQQDANRAHAARADPASAPRPNSNLAHPAQTPPLPQRAGSLAKAIHVPQKHELTAG